MLIRHHMDATASCLISIWILKELPHYIFYYSINYSWNPQRGMEGGGGTDNRANTRTPPPPPEVDSVFCTYSLKVHEPCILYKCLLRTLKEMEVDEEEWRDISHRQRDAVREMTAETDGRGQEAADGRRWEVEHLGEAEGWRGVKDSVDERCRIKEEARQTARQRPAWEQPTRLAASAINNASDVWYGEQSAGLAQDSDALHHCLPQ